MPVPDSLSAAQVRRINLAAQGFASRRPTGRVDRRHLRRVFDTVGPVQIDSVNVLVRSHYLPFFSRLGPYDRRLLDDLAYRHREAFEYWGHEACLVPVRLHPHLRWRMAEPHRWTGVASVADRRADLVESLREVVLAEGPVGAGELDGEGRKGPWWGWGDTKRVLELLFARGEVGALRRSTFERAYCAPHLAVPVEILDRPTPSPDEARAELIVVAASSYGVATAKDLADFWRLRVDDTKRLLDGLVADGRMRAVTIEGWRQPAYLHPEARLPRRVEARALVSPFDSVMWERARVERLYGFRYAIEIYVPKPKRVYGYYVLPFLLGDRYVARVDLKADRAGRRLLVQSAHGEEGIDDLEVAEALALELREMAAWLDLDDVTVRPQGDLAAALTACLST